MGNFKRLLSVNLLSLLAYTLFGIAVYEALVAVRYPEYGLPLYVMYGIYLLSLDAIILLIIIFPVEIIISLIRKHPTLPQIKNKALNIIHGILFYLGLILITLYTLFAIHVFIISGFHKHWFNIP